MLAFSAAFEPDTGEAQDIMRAFSKVLFVIVNRICISETIARKFCLNKCNQDKSLPQLRYLGKL